jgi:hypothetical protein
VLRKHNCRFESCLAYHFKYIPTGICIQQTIRGSQVRVLAGVPINKMKLDKYLPYYRGAQNFLYHASYWPNGQSRTKVTKNFKAFCEALELDFMGNQKNHPNLPAHIFGNSPVFFYIQWQSINLAFKFFLDGRIEIHMTPGNKTIKELTNILFKKVKGQ